MVLPTVNFIYACEKPQRKTFFLDGNFKTKQKATPFNKYWISRNVEVHDLRSLQAAIQKRLTSSNAEYYAIIRGSWPSEEELFGFEEERKSKVAQLSAEGKEIASSVLDPLITKEGKHAHLLRRKALMRDVARNWVCFDFDGLEIEGAGPFDVAEPEKWVDRAILAELGPDFAVADYVLQLSSSAGLKHGISAHCWFWLEEPMDGYAWRAWYARRTQELGRKPKIDKSLFDVERIHFIAPPVFEKGCVDPVLDAIAERFQYFERLEPTVVLSGQETLVSSTRVLVNAISDFDLETADETGRAQDAFDRPGVVGAFNRCFSMSDTINRFLHHEYRIDTPSGRVTWLNSPSDNPQGCRIVGNNTRMFSTHSNDPLGGFVGTAFDHVEAILFGGDFTSTAEWARSIPEVAGEMERVELGVFDDELPSESFVADIVVESKTEKQKVIGPDDIMAEYPMPKKWMGADASYRLIGGSWVYGYEKPDESDDDGGGGKKKKRSRAAFVELWSPISMIREYISEDTGQITVEFKVQGREGEPRTLMMAKNTFAGNNNLLIGELVSLGWRFTVNSDKAFINFIRYSNNSELFYSQDNRGWNKQGDRFAAPSGEVIGQGGGRTFLRPDLKIAENCALGGSLEGWQRAATVALSYEQCAHWALAIAAGFAGPLTGLLNLPNSGLALCGETSRGKTTALALAVSAWSSPDPLAAKDGGLMVSLKGTSNSIEVLAENANHTVLALDETAMMRAQDLESLVFAVTSGSGKARMNITGHGLRRSAAWQTFVLISGEQGLAERFESATGSKMAKGAVARVLDVNVDSFDSRVNDISAVREMSALIKANFGFAGPAFVHGLFERGYVNRVGELRQRLDAHSKLLAEDATGLVGRVAHVVALLMLSVELAVEFKVLPESAITSVSNAINLVWGGFKDSNAADTQLSIIEDVRNWVISKLNVSIIPLDNIGSRQYKEAEAWHDGTLIYVPTHKAEDMTKGAFRKIAIARALCNGGILRRHRQDQFSASYIPRVGNAISHYRLDAASLGVFLQDGEFETEEAA